MANREHASAKELYLVDKYPVLFAQWSLSAMQSCLGRGIECSEGWYDILDRQSEELVALNLKRQAAVAESTDPDAEYTPVQYGQIKEKFGELRVYIDGYCDEARAIIGKYALESCETCEFCGSKDDVILWGGWIQAECRECRVLSTAAKSFSSYAYMRTDSRYRDEVTKTHDEAVEALRGKMTDMDSEALKVLPENYPDSVADKYKTWFEDGITDQAFVAQVHAYFADYTRKNSLRAKASDLMWRGLSKEYRGFPQDTIAKSLGNLGYIDDTFEKELDL